MVREAPYFPLKSRNPFYPEFPARFRETSDVKRCFLLSGSPKGNKLEMFAGVKNQMSGWLSGGIPGLSRGAGAGEGEAPPSAETEEIQAPQEIQAPVGEPAKDDDASR